MGYLQTEFKLYIWVNDNELVDTSCYAVYPSAQEVKSRIEAVLELQPDLARHKISSNVVTGYEYISEVS